MKFNDYPVPTPTAIIHRIHKAPGDDPIPELFLPCGLEDGDGLSLGFYPASSGLGIGFCLNNGSLGASMVVDRESARAFFTKALTLLNESEEL